jgi:hypothetical protein
MGRAERRHQLKQDEKRLARGVDVRRRDPHDLVALMRILHERVQISVRKRSVRPLMEYVYANLQAGTEHIAEVRVACFRGCSHCCNQWVEASAPEVFFAVGTMTSSQRTGAVEAVAAACKQTAGLPFETRQTMLTPCPLLEGDECGLYLGRPLACRTAVSTDADICYRAFRLFSGEGIPFPAAWHGLRQGYTVALEGALLRAGLAHRYREWNESLRLALADPQSEAQWLSGSDVFAGAPSTNAPPTFNHRDWRALYVEAFGSFP